MRKLAFVLTALSLACGSTEPPETAPDLTGFYNLLSITSPDLAGGTTLTPPIAVATLDLAQYTGNGVRAIGDVVYSIEIDDPPFAVSTGGSGDYRQEANGGDISITLNGFGLAGRYTLDGDTLTMYLQGGTTRVPLPTGATVWLRDDSP